MQTILRSEKLLKSTEGPVVIIGEKINPTGHKKMAAHCWSETSAISVTWPFGGAPVRSADVNVGVRTRRCS
jgi:cobalamin-dependent methionine synthase I